MRSGIFFEEASVFLLRIKLFHLNFQRSTFIFLIVGQQNPVLFRPSPKTWLCHLCKQLNTTPAVLVFTVRLRPLVVSLIMTGSKEEVR